MKKIFASFLVGCLLFVSTADAGRNFDGTTSDFLELTSTPISAYPFSFACWVRVENYTSFNGVIHLADNSASNIHYSIELAFNRDGFAVAARNTSYVDARGTDGHTANIWYHVGGNFTSATDRELFVVGASDATSAISVTFSGNVDNFSIGSKQDGAPENSMDGDIAECALWDVALSDQEFSNLANGENPVRVQTDNLQSYIPILGNSTEADLSGNQNNMTVNGTSVSNHAPVGPLVIP